MEVFRQMTIGYLQENVSLLELNGHCCIRQAMPKQELRTILGLTRRLTAQGRNNAIPQADLEDDFVSRENGIALRENLWRYSAGLRSSFLRGTLAQIASDIFSIYRGGSGKVALFADYVWFKEPGAESSPWHQDGTYLPLPDINCLTFWIPFHQITKDMSPMSYVSRSNSSCWLQIGKLDSQDACRTQDLNTTRRSNPLPGLHTQDFNTTRLCLEAEEYSITTYNDLELGDILVHDPWTLHGSSDHTGTETRFAISVAYYDVAGRVELVPSIRLNSSLKTEEILRVRQQALDDLFPGMNNVDLLGNNPRTPALLLKSSHREIKNRPYARQ